MSSCITNIINPYTGFFILNDGYPIIYKIYGNNETCRKVVISKNLLNIDSHQFIDSHKAFYQLGKEENDVVHVKMEAKEAKMESSSVFGIIFAIHLMDFPQNNYLKIYFEDNYGNRIKNSEEEDISNGKSYHLSHSLRVIALSS